jgi:hypothetical protein
MSLRPSNNTFLTETELGYRFDPPEQTTPYRLSVWLRAAPTGRHYDPESVQCLVTTSPDSVEPLSIEHPWSLANAYQVSAGRIVLSDRKAKPVEAFTFGGQLQIDSTATVTQCTFDSTAPILPLLDSDSPIAPTTGPTHLYHWPVYFSPINTSESD